MHPNLSSSLKRAEELFGELRSEHAKALADKNVGDKTVHLTHEIMEKLRGTLDRTARR
jgi:hypothetical protein